MIKALWQSLTWYDRVGLIGWLLFVAWILGGAL